MSKVKFTITSNSVAVYYDNKSDIFDRDSQTGKDVIDLIKKGNEGKLLKYLRGEPLVKGFDKMTGFEAKDFTIENGLVLYKGVQVPRNVSKRILDLKKNNLPYANYLEFTKKLMQNPSYMSVNELLDFLERHNSPINKDGDFVCWKMVRQDYKDVHSGTILNKPGLTIKFERNQVDDNRNQGCSKGLHVGSFDFAKGFHSGGHLLEVTVNPKNVVSVPSDCNFAKIRVCEYYIVKELPNLNAKTQDELNDEEWDDDEDFDTCPDCLMHEDDCICYEDD